MTLHDTAATLADKAACAEVIQAWGVYRDQGKWKELRSTFTPDGHISVSWFRGPFEQFVERCRANYGTGWSRHHLFVPTVRLAGDRADLRIRELATRYLKQWHQAIPTP